MTLEAIHLFKHYSHKKAVQDVSLNMKRGEVVGLLGPNGAGKTTCFYMVLGLIAADKGQILLNQQDITSLPVHQRATLGIGYLPQEASIFRNLNVSDNILAILELKYSDKTLQQKRLKALLQEFHLEGIRHSKGISLSGGERRRVEIARALATEPHYILLDEPFAGVDPLSISEIKRLIIKLSRQDIGVLITDHNVKATLEICQRAYIMHQGQVLAHGTPLELLNNASVRQVYLGEDFKL